MQTQRSLCLRLFLAFVSEPSAGGGAQSVQRRCTGCTTDVLSPAEAREFPVSHNVQAGSEVYPASYSMEAEGNFPGELSGGNVKLHLVPR